MDSLYNLCSAPVTFSERGNPPSINSGIDGLFPETNVPVSTELPLEPAAAAEVVGLASEVKFLNPSVRRAIASNLVLPLGVAGRGIVRRMIGEELRVKPHLRPVVKSIGKLKSATIPALIEMCLVTGTLQQATRISINFMEQRGRKKISAKGRQKASPKSARGARSSRDVRIDQDSQCPTTNTSPGPAYTSSAGVELEPPISLLPCSGSRVSAEAAVAGATSAAVAEQQQHHHSVLIATSPAAMTPLETFSALSSTSSSVDLFHSGTHCEPPLGSPQPAVQYGIFDEHL